jgi:hypothetical protein
MAKNKSTEIPKNFDIISIATPASRGQLTKYENPIKCPSCKRDTKSYYFYPHIEILVRTPNKELQTMRFKNVELCFFCQQPVRRS